MHASVVRHYFDGGSFPVGGSSQIVKTIDPIITAAGGTILVSADVENVIIENNTAVGVRMMDGNQLYAKNIVSNAGIMTTYNKLIPQKEVEKYAIKKQLQKVNRSVSHASLYIGLDGSPEELGIPKCNYWVYPEKGDHDNCVHNYLKAVSYTHLRAHET